MKKLLLFLSFCLVGIGGCSPAMLVSPIVNGVIMWKDGEAQKYYQTPTPVVYRALKRSLASMDLTLGKDDISKDGLYHITAGNKDRFKIKIQQVENNITRLSIRVNVMGDKPYAELIYHKVDAELNLIEFDKEGNPARRLNRPNF